MLRKNNRVLGRVVLLATVTVLAGCATSSGPSSPPLVGGNVQYGDAKAVETVTNTFGSTDLQMIAESMTRSMLQSPALTAGKRRPLITVNEVKNKTSEYIDTRAITDSILTQLTKSGLVRFAVDTADMQDQTEELARQNQSGLYKKSSSKKMGKMEGADFRLVGSISSIVKRTQDIHDVYYKFSLRLTEIESGVVEWADEKEIRKTTSAR
ncbi:penicillin-binding protein activator LpoB [Candidatus Magnetaquicoccus inordinatus]|uniref:penicillin-binding protein activator LpoB n=1 Tax=Candidatus Magnetaquicoccus inordinatus TaxID=2496818 RepID=UPI00102BA679|nr:penicillin-binding protein activator LpoB [Candidatus Magnetaquicoccus inordinatus]